MPAMYLRDSVNSGRDSVNFGRDLGGNFDASHS